jgi:hypothetical protein
MRSCVGVSGESLVLHCNPGYFAGLVAAALLVFTARMTQVKAQQLSTALAEFGAASLDELDERVREEDRQITTAVTLAHERGRLIASADKSLALLDAELANVLDRAGVPALGITRSPTRRQTLMFYVRQRRDCTRLPPLAFTTGNRFEAIIH